MHYWFCIELYGRIRKKRSNLKFLNFNAYFCETDPNNFQTIPLLIGLPLGKGVKSISDFYVLLQGHGTPKAVLANQNEAQHTFSQTTFLKIFFMSC